MLTRRDCEFLKWLFVVPPLGGIDAAAFRLKPVLQTTLRNNNPPIGSTMNKISITTPAELPARRSLTRSILTTLLTIIVVVTIAITAWKLHQQHDLTAPLTSYSFLAATILAILYRIANPFGWNLVVRGMGHDVNAIESTRIWLLAESRRWLPGGIWGYTSRAVASKEIGLTKTVATASMAIELLATIAAAACVSAIGVAIYYRELYSTVCELGESSGLNSSIALWLAVALIGSAAATWLLREKLKQKVSKTAQKFESLRGVKIQTKWLMGSIGYLTLMAVLNGAINSVLLNAVSSSSVPLVAMIAATATAWIIGFFAFFSPGGILVREAALAALLLPWLPYEVGFSVAILSRFAQLIAEATGMGVAVSTGPDA